jgi:hypothetical protein
MREENFLKKTTAYSNERTGYSIHDRLNTIENIWVLVEAKNN